MVRSPVTFKPFAPDFSTLVLLKVMSGNFAASKKSGDFRCSSSFGTPVCKPSSGKVTEIDDLVRSAVSRLNSPVNFSSDALGLENPKWFQLKITSVWVGSMSYFCGAAEAEVTETASSEVSKMRRNMCGGSLL